MECQTKRGAGLALAEHSSSTLLFFNHLSFTLTCTGQTGCLKDVSGCLEGVRGGLRRCVWGFGRCGWGFERMLVGILRVWVGV